MRSSLKQSHSQKTSVFHQAPENPTALLGSAGFLRLATLALRLAPAAATPFARRCDWKTAHNTAE
ncbi:hypothetical protein GCM10007864_18940 [Sinorhizobium fredii]|nr:hypothetical protein GCM10007864_18940 [Sinorhizobium fredii]